MEVSLGLEPLVQLAADGIRSLAIKTGNKLTEHREKRFNDKLLKALNAIMTESLPGETAMHSPTSYGWPDLLVPHVQHVWKDHVKSVEFCQTVAERNIESFYKGRLHFKESQKIVQTIVRYHCDPHRSLAFNKIVTELVEGKPLLGSDFMQTEYEPGWMLIEYETASILNSSTVVHTPQRVNHGLIMTFSHPIKAAAVRSTIEGVLVLICADENRMVELCACKICSNANDGLAIDWGPLFQSLNSFGFQRAMYVLAMFLELQARDDLSRFQWDSTDFDLRLSDKLVHLEELRLKCNRAYLKEQRSHGMPAITLSFPQFRALTGTNQVEKNKVKEQLRLKYVEWSRYLEREDELVLMRSEDWRPASISDALDVLDKALESICCLTPPDKRFSYKRSGAELLSEIRFATMLQQYNAEGELVLNRGLESSLHKKHVTVLSGRDAGCLYRFGTDAAIVYIKGGEILPMTMVSKQPFTNFVGIHPIKRQAAVISYISDQLNSRETAQITSWVKQSSVNILYIVDRFVDTILNCFQRRERNSISTIRQSVARWAASDIEKAGLEREVLDMMMRMGFRDDGNVIGSSSYYDAVDEIETFPRQSGATLTLDQPVWLDGLGVVEVSDGEWALISDSKKKAVRIDARDAKLNVIPETASSTGFTILSPIVSSRADVHLIKFNPLGVGEGMLKRKDMRIVGGRGCRTATVMYLSGGN